MATTAVPDAVLLQQFCAARSEAAFAQIVSRHGGLVYRACLRMVGNPTDAEDAVQAVFLVLAQRCRSVDGPLGPWLLAVARRVAHNLIVARTRRQRHEHAAAKVETPAENNPAGLREELDAALAQLPAPLAEAVLLRYLEGRSQQEAAEISGCPQGTLGRRAMEGLNRLRVVLGRRGVVVAPAFLAAYMTQQQALAVPAALTAKLALAATGKAAFSASVCVLADAAGKAALAVKLKVAAALVLAGAVLGTGVVVALRPSVESREAMVLLHFDGATPPTNQVGDGFPKPHHEPGNADPGGRFLTSIEPADAVAGHSLRLRLMEGRLKAHFTPAAPPGQGNLFARDYAADPANWRFNTYNRLRFWVKLPRNSSPHSTSGGTNMAFGTSVRRVENSNAWSLDEGGGGYGHWFNVPAIERWTLVTLNMHPSFGGGPTPPSNLPHPTGEARYNYFDALTQFYIESRERPSKYPADYMLDEMEFYREPQPENDEQVYSIAATHVPAEGRIVLTWNRRFGEDDVAHEVRYGFTDIHRLGWQQAAAAPDGVIQPPGRGTNLGMLYDTRALPLAGQKVIYLAIKPKNAEAFSQIAIPLTLK